MILFYENIKDSISYALSDWNAVVIIGIIFFVSSIINKHHLTNLSYLRVFNVLMLMSTGYGSYITWYTLKGYDKLPIIGNVKKLLWEGFRKGIVIFVYSTVLTFLIHCAKIYFIKANMLFALFFAILFSVVYMFLIGGLLNRYLNGGKILKAFNLVEIAKLVLIFDKLTFCRVAFAVIIAQVFTISCFVDFDRGFTLIELLYSILTFFLAPFLFFATKRFVGLNIRELLKNGF